MNYDPNFSRGKAIFSKPPTHKIVVREQFAKMAEILAVLVYYIKTGKPPVRHPDKSYHSPDVMFIEETNREGHGRAPTSKPTT